jgi:uncharacterized protein (DUF2384 family)
MAESAAKQARGLAPALEELETLATAVFGDKDVGIRWLRQPNLATDNAPPVDLLMSEGGLERVKNLLLRIEYGVLA